MKWTSKSGGEITLQGTPDQIEAVEAFLKGACWIGLDDDQELIRRDRFEPCEILPDPLSEGRWAPAPAGLARYTAELPPPLKDEDSSPQIHVAHICGYSYSPERYDERSARLHNAGFICMRSPRERDGGYWETWVLHGKWAAAGPIAGFTNEKIISWLCRNIIPGQIFIVKQECGLALD